VCVLEGWGAKCVRLLDRGMTERRLSVMGLVQADVVANHIRQHLLALRAQSTYAIALEPHTAPASAPAASAPAAPTGAGAAGSSSTALGGDRALLPFKAGDVIFVTRYGAGGHWR
jgi:hypothetical protein